MKAKFLKQVKFKADYLYPINEVSSIMCKITKTKSLPVHYIELFEKLGIEVEIETLVDDSAGKLTGKDK